ncbi:MAG: hypothetical protein VKP72_14470 [bacterium]|nr:hypothetical protein [bacterium]
MRASRTLTALLVCLTWALAGCPQPATSPTSPVRTSGGEHPHVSILSQMSGAQPAPEMQPIEPPPGMDRIGPQEGAPPAPQPPAESLHPLPDTRRPIPGAPDPDRDLEGFEAPPADASALVLQGTLQGPTQGYQTQATYAQAIASASVSLQEMAGYALASGLSNDSGAFNIVPSGFIPASGSCYVVEAARGLGGIAPGKSGVRFRTIVRWNGLGWNSITGSTTIVINPLTTAIAIASCLNPSTLPPENTMGKVSVSGATSTLNASPVLPGYPDNDLQALAATISTYLAYDLDPTAMISGWAPEITGTSVNGGLVGDLIQINGTGFSPIASENVVRFNGTAATVWIAEPRRLIVQIPSGATTGTLTVATSRGTSAGRAFSVGPVTITVDPNGYMGAWHVPGIHSTWQHYRKSVVLARNRIYQMRVNVRESFRFLVDDSGNVQLQTTPTNGNLYATAGNALLTFKTVNLTVDVDSMTWCPWHIWGATEWQEGNRTVVLLPSNANRIYIYGVPGYIGFDTDASGLVTVSGGTSAATGGQNLLKLNCVTFNVDTQGMARFPWIINGQNRWQYENGSVRLPRHRTYYLGISGTSWTWRNLEIDATGNLVCDDPTVAVNNATKTLTYKTTTVNFNVNGYGSVGVGTNHYWGWWYIMGQWNEGNDTVKLVNGSTYWMWIHGTTTWFSITVDKDGNVSSTYPDIVTCSGQNVSFNVANLTVDRAGYNTNSPSGKWYIYAVGGLYSQTEGNPTLPLVKGVWYYMLPDGDWDYYSLFRLNSAGVVESQNPTTFTGTVNKITFNTVDISVNPNGWVPKWSIRWMNWPGFQGPGSIKVLRGRKYTLWPACYMYWYPSYWSDFQVDAAGNVSSGPLHTGGAQSITFNTQRIRFSWTATGTTWDAEGLWWYLWGLSGWQTGTSVDMTLIKGMPYTFYQWPHYDKARQFSIGSDGNLSTSSFTAPDGVSTVTLTKI